MKLNVYSIFDTATGVYSRPFFMLSDAEAIRAFSDIVQNKETDVGKHPEDYNLFRIGNYDDNTAKLISENKECLATALETISQSNE